MSEKKKPKFSLKVGACEVALWEQESQKGNFLTLSSHRNYKDKDDKWQTANTLRVNDIPAMAMAMQKAYEWAKLEYKEEKKE